MQGGPAGSMLQTSPGTGVSPSSGVRPNPGRSMNPHEAERVLQSMTISDRGSSRGEDRAVGANLGAPTMGSMGSAYLPPPVPEPYERPSAEAMQRPAPPSTLRLPMAPPIPPPVPVPPVPPPVPPEYVLYYHPVCPNCAPVMDALEQQPHLLQRVHVEDLSRYSAAVVRDLSFLRGTPTLAHLQTGAIAGGATACLHQLSQLVA